MISAASMRSRSMRNSTTNSVQISVSEPPQPRAVDGETLTEQQSQDSFGSSESRGSQSAIERNGSDQLRGVMPEIKAAVDQLLAAAEDNNADRVRWILMEQGLVPFHKLAETGVLDVIIQQQGLTKLLHYGEQTGNIDLMKIVLNDPQLGQGCTGFLLDCCTGFPGQTKVRRLHLLKDDGEITTALGSRDQNRYAENLSQEIPTGKPAVAESLEKRLKNYKNAINAILVGAAVLVGVTFQFFLVSLVNPPFILIYCVYANLSFYSAVATMIIAAGAALPVSYRSIKEEERTIRKRVMASSSLLAVSIIFVLGAVPGPNYGNRPRLTRNVFVTTSKCVGLFLCAAAMTDYVLRLSWKFSRDSDEDKLKQWSALQLLPKLRLRLRQFVGVPGLFGLIYSLFLAFLFFLPFYARLPHEWEPAPPAAAAPAPQPG